MSPQQAELFLKAVGCSDPVWKDDEWLLDSCPMAKWTHKSKTDSSASFGLRLPPNEEPYYHCFACHSGSPEDLINRIQLYAHNDGTLKGRNLKAARDILENADLSVVPLKDYESVTNVQVFEEWPQWFLNNFPAVQLYPVAVEYLKARGITFEEMIKFDLRFDLDREMVVFPYRDAFGRLAGARGRCINPTHKVGHHDYKVNGRNNSKLVFLNEQCMQTHSSVVLVEGQFDVVKTMRIVPNVIGNLTAKPTHEKLQKLSFMERLYLLMDNDDTGRLAAQKYHEALGSKLEVISITIPEPYKDPDSMPTTALQTLLNQSGVLCETSLAVKLPEW